MVASIRPAQSSATAAPAGSSSSAAKSAGSAPIAAMSWDTVCVPARGRLADVHAFAEQIRDAGDAGVAARQHRDRLGIERHDAAQVGHRPGLGEGAGALVGVALPVRLHQGEVELALAERHEVVARAGGGLGAAAQVAVLGAVQRVADRGRRGVVAAAHVARAEREELQVLRGSRRGEREGGEKGAQHRGLRIRPSGSGE